MGVDWCCALAFLDMISPQRDGTGRAQRKAASDLEDQKRRWIFSGMDAVTTKRFDFRFAVVAFSCFTL